MSTATPNKPRWDAKAVAALAALAIIMFVPFALCIWMVGAVAKDLLISVVTFSPDSWSKGLWKAGAEIGAGVWVFIAYLVGGVVQKQYGTIKGAIGIVAACLLLAFMAYDKLGTHEEDVDPETGSGETVVDYVPTNEAREVAGISTFFVSAVPALAGLAAQRRVVRSSGVRPQSPEPTGADV